jgi:hypothetical protein
MDKPALLEKLHEIEKCAKECIVLIEKKTESHQNKWKESQLSDNMDFSMPIRAFIKKYSKRLSGPKKFTLLVAYLSQGDLEKEVKLTDVVENWDKMRSKNLLGMQFNRFYAITAKDNDWVKTKKHGIYSLRPSWKGIFEK